jgi:hypothetical protein
MDGPRNQGHFKIDKHPVWCSRSGCETDGVHTSRVASANLGGEITGVSAYFSEVFYEGARVQGIVIQFAEGPEVESYLLEIPQAQALHHILQRFTRLG